jgi:hypothetical protein
LGLGPPMARINDQVKDGFLLGSYWIYSLAIRPQISFVKWEMDKLKWVMDLVKWVIDNGD